MVVTVTAVAKIEIIDEKCKIYSNDIDVINSNKSSPDENGTPGLEVILYKLSDVNFTGWLSRRAGVWG